MDTRDKKETHELTLRGHQGIYDFELEHWNIKGKEFKRLYIHCHYHEEDLNYVEDSRMFFDVEAIQKLKEFLKDV